MMREAVHARFGALRASAVAGMPQYTGNFQVKLTHVQALRILGT